MRNGDCRSLSLSKREYAKAKRGRRGERMSDGNNYRTDAAQGRRRQGGHLVPLRSRSAVLSGERRAGQETRSGFSPWRTLAGFQRLGLRPPSPPLPQHTPAPLLSRFSSCFGWGRSVSIPAFSTSFPPETRALSGSPRSGSLGLWPGFRAVSLEEAARQEERIHGYFQPARDKLFHPQLCQTSSLY